MAGRQRHGLAQPTPAISTPLSLSFASQDEEDLYLRPILQLLHVGRELSAQTQDVYIRLCQEVAAITQERAQLILRGTRASYGASAGVPSQGLLSSISFPIQYGKRVYGTLHIATDTAHPGFPAIPLPFAHLLAEVCSWILPALEQSAFLRMQVRGLTVQAPESLTKREREVLALICRGCSEEEIAQALTVAPATVGKHRQHIYEKLGAHSEREVRLVAYQSGLYSPFVA